MDSGNITDDADDHENTRQSINILTNVIYDCNVMIVQAIDQM
jgi:hypothetical protein